MLSLSNSVHLKIEVAITYQSVVAYYPGPCPSCPLAYVPASYYSLLA